MSRQSIAIFTNTPGPGCHRIEVDGHDISNAVSRATLWLGPGELPELDMELRVFETQRIDAEAAEVTIPDSTREALIKLGWTPPEDQPSDKSSPLKATTSVTSNNTTDEDEAATNPAP